MRVCIHPLGYQTRICRCGLKYLHCPRCQPNLSCCDSCLRFPHALRYIPNPYAGKRKLITKEQARDRYLRYMKKKRERLTYDPAQA